MDELSRGECPVCGERHRPKFHCFVHRTYRRDPKEEGEEIAAIYVVRIFCEINYRIRKSTGEPKQYTLTILPGFLIPHSRIPVDPVHQALDDYITKGGLKQQGAAMEMRCLSAASFRLFYLRIRSRIDGWTDWLVQLVLALGGRVKDADVDHVQSREPEARWSWFVLLASEYVRLYSRLPSAEVIARRYLWQHIYAALSRHRMGLGP
jgi:hypothetical protein